MSQEKMVRQNEIQEKSYRQKEKYDNSNPLKKDGLE